MKATFTLLIKQKVREPLLQADLFIIHFPDCFNNSAHEAPLITVTPKHESHTALLEVVL